MRIDAIINGNTPKLKGARVTRMLSGTPHALFRIAKRERANDFRSALDSCRLLQENIRIYAVYRGKSSPFPCDEQEQDCLDLFHELFAVVQRAHGLPCAPRRMHNLCNVL